MSSTPIDQLVSMMTNMGFDASGVSLTEAQQLVATARASMHGSIPGSSSQGVPDRRAVDHDDIPLTLLQRYSREPTIVNVEESTDTAQAAAAIASPSPVSPTMPMTGPEGEQPHVEQLPQDTVTATGSTSAAKAPPASVH
eukprot:6485825-Amphidinium_carterae.1